MSLLHAYDDAPEGDGTPQTLSLTLSLALTLTLTLTRHRRAPPKP